MTTVDRQHIEERIANWEKRIDDLYKHIEEVLRSISEVSCRKNRETTMNEELMQKFEIGPKNVPILDIYKNESMKVSFKPKGLWVIGANGRIDILTEAGSYLLVDKADYGQPPEWSVHSPDSRRTGSLFDDNYIVELVRNA